MTKYEFLEKMRHALANDLSGPVVQENVNYYDSYISGEVRNGRSEAAVIEELGDPWALARTIIESLAKGDNTGNVQDESMYGSEQQAYRQKQVRVFGLGSWWKRLLLVLGIVGVIMVVVAVIGGIFSLLAPVLVPFLIVVFVLRIIDRNRWR